MMRIEHLHSESRRVEPVDRQTRQEQRRKDEERSQREEQEDAYILNLSRGNVDKSSPFISGAYTRMGAVQPAPKVLDTPSESETKAQSIQHKPVAKPADTADSRPRLDTYS